jgi:hypothetical protein
VTDFSVHMTRRLSSWKPQMRKAIVAVLVLLLLGAATARADDGPRYDVPRGFTRCPHATAWHGFFKWASERHSDCRRAGSFMRAYAARAGGAKLPRYVSGYRCSIRYFHDDEGAVYASRHVCRRGTRTIRFYGMV